MHEHGHIHGHHHHDHQVKAMGGVLIVSIILNMVYVIAEAGTGFWSGSLGLISDAGHNLGDVFTLMLALIAFKLSTTHSSKRYTYGYRKASVLISLLNAILLLAAVGAIVSEAVRNLASPDMRSLDGTLISITAGIGIIVNGITTWMLSRGDKNDINTRGAFLHMLADTLVSVAVVFSGIVIRFTGFTMIDPILSLVVALVILITAWKLLAQSFRMSIDAVPDNIDVDDICTSIATCEGVKDVHHIHIWPISTTEVALTAHVVVDELGTSPALVSSIKDMLKDKGVQHSTIEVEISGTECPDKECN